MAGIGEDEKSLVPQLPHNTSWEAHRKKKKIQFKEIKGEGMEVGSQDVHNGASDVNRRKGRNDDEGGERLC